MPNWKFYVERKFNYYIEWVQAECTKPEWQERALGFSFPLQNYLILNGAEFFDEDGLGAYNKFLDEQSRQDEKFFENFLSRQYGLGEAARKFEEALLTTAPDLAGASDESLLELYDEFLQYHITIFSLAFLRPDEYLEQRLKEELLKMPSISEINVDQVFKTVAVNKTEGLEKLDYIEEPIDLLRIAAEAKEQGKTLSKDKKWFEEKVALHSQKYAWMKNPFSYEIEKTENEQYFQRLREFLKQDPQFKLKKIEDDRRLDKFNFHLAVKQYVINHDAYRYIRYIRDAMYLRTFVTEAVDRLYFTARQTILTEIANRMNMKEGDLAALIGEEVKRFFSEHKTPDIRIIKERKKAFVAIWEDGKSRLVYGEEAEDLFEQYDSLIQENSKDGQIRKISGQVAFEAEKVTGTAKVLKTADDVHRVKKGEIVVISSAKPEYSVALGKAAALITDKGNVTCHAAKISREMKIPCIIGTGNGTRVIEDGSLVEVDTEKGIVRIIK